MERASSELKEMERYCFNGKEISKRLQNYLWCLLCFATYKRAHVGHVENTANSNIRKSNI